VQAWSVLSEQPGDNVWTRCERVEPDFVQVGEMTLVVTGKGYADENDQDSSPYTFDPNTLKVDMREQRREMRLRFRSNTQNGDYFMGRVLSSLDTGDVRGREYP
jgi:predicted homoserine dehydrogenase-like protein